MECEEQDLDLLGNEPGGSADVKIYKHIQPRLDPDLYQCSIPDELKNIDRDEQAGTRHCGALNIFECQQPSKSFAST